MINLDALYNEKNTQAASSGLSLDALYSGNAQDNTGSLDALYNGTASNVGNGAVNTDVIEQIESAGNNAATSGAGAKGLYQFMPDTSEQYSKRLFGKGTRDASTLSPEQQKQMSNAYFNDLLKEFNGDADKAIAAYNWGQGNLEKDISANGEDWKSHLPKETADYLQKYHRLNGEGYSHETKENKGGWEGSKEYMSNQWEQIKDLGKGANAEIHKLFGADYDQEDIDQMKAALDTDEGKQLKTSAAVAASIVAPELIPELAGEGAAIKGANWLAKGLASSEAYQAVDKGKLSIKDTAEDLATGAALEGGAHALLKPAMKQISKAFSSLLESKSTNEELTSKVREYLGAARAEELGKNWKNLRETDSQATLLDAYEYMGKQVPEVWKNGAIEDVKPFVRGFKNNGSHSELISSAKTIKQGLYEEAKALAKSDADKRLLSNIAEANESVNGMAISNDALSSTPLQKAGETVQEWLGYSMPKGIQARRARKALQPEVDALTKDLLGDNRRIGRELKSLNGKYGASITSKSNALNKQRNANNKMIEFLKNGMDGKKVRIADIQTAIKDVQEEQFSTGKFKGLTQRFKNLSDKFEAAQVYSLQSEKSYVSDLVKHGVKHSVHALGMSVPVVGGLSTIAGSAAKASKSANLQFAKELVEAVQEGTMTEAEAKKAIAARVANKAAGFKKIASPLRDMFDNQ